MHGNESPMRGYACPMRAHVSALRALMVADAWLPIGVVGARISDSCARVDDHDGLGR
jgi:hypothetical protein